MNKAIITTLASIALASLVFAGCSTTPANSPVTDQAIIIAAQLGTATVLTKSPQDAPYFIAAETVLQGLAGSTNQVNVTSVKTALAAAGETNPIVTLAIVDALNLADAYIASNGSTNTSAFQNAAGDVATGIAQGIQAGATGYRSKLKK